MARYLILPATPALEKLVRKTASLLTDLLKGDPVPEIKEEKDGKEGEETITKVIVYPPEPALELIRELISTHVRGRKPSRIHFANRIYKRGEIHKAVNSTGQKILSKTKHQYPGLFSILKNWFRNGKNTISFVMFVPVVVIMDEEGKLQMDEEGKLKMNEGTECSEPKLQMKETGSAEDWEKVQMSLGESALVFDNMKFTAPKDRVVAVFRVPTGLLEVGETAD